MSIGYDSLIKKETMDYEEYQKQILEKIFSINFENENKISKTTNHNYEYSTIFRIICNAFYPFFNKTQINNELKKFKDLELVDNYSFDTKELEFILNSMKFKIKKLNKSVIDINKNDFYGNNFNINMCISKVIELSKKLKYSNTLVIGYLNDKFTKTKKIHCWLEYNDNNKDYVIDFSNNILTSKENYYILTQAEVINKLKNSELNNDIISLLYRTFNLKHEEILCFYHELTKDLRKTKQLTF